MDREPFHLRCLAAVCGCAPGRDCLCPVLAAYARRCAQEGASSPWRSQTLCRESTQPAGPAQRDPRAFRGVGRAPRRTSDLGRLLACLLPEAQGVWHPEADRAAEAMPLTCFVSLCPAVLCPGGQEYQECAPVCGRSCGQPEDCGELGGCVAGCNCPSGLLWDPEGQCVPPSLCPCQLGARRYALGSATMKDCNRW